MGYKQIQFGCIGVKVWGVPKAWHHCFVSFPRGGVNLKLEKKETLIQSLDIILLFLFLNLLDSDSMLPMHAVHLSGSSQQIDRYVVFSKPHTLWETHLQTGSAYRVSSCFCTLSDRDCFSICQSFRYISHLTFPWLFHYQCLPILSS